MEKDQSNEKEKLRTFLSNRKKELQETAQKNQEAEKLLKDRLSEVYQQRITINAQLALIADVEIALEEKVDIGALQGKKIAVPFNLKKTVDLPTK